MVVGLFPLESKLAVVTGGGSGINLAFVRLALQNDCKCLIADLRLTPEAESLLRDSSGKLKFTICNVANWRDLDSLPQKVKDAFGPDAIPDIWIAGAGIFDGSSFQRDDQEEERYNAMRINAEHPIKLTRIAIRSALGANKPAVILIVASEAGIHGFYASALYCASKHAVVGFVKSMMQADQDENIRISAILPSLVATPMWTGSSEEATRNRSQFAYNDEYGLRAEEVAEGMKDLIEDGEKWPGGSLMQISKQDMRKKLESAQTVVIDSPQMEMWAGHVYGPIREAFVKERGGK